MNYKNYLNQIQEAYFETGYEDDVDNLAITKTRQNEVPYVFRDLLGEKNFKMAKTIKTKFKLSDEDIFKELIETYLNDEKVIKGCIENKIYPLNYESKFGWTLFSWACKMRDEKALKILLSYDNLNPNIKTDFGRSGIFICLDKTDDLSIPKMIMKHPKFDPTILNGKNTILDYMNDYTPELAKFKEKLSRTVRKKTVNHPLQTAAEVGTEKFTEFVLSLGGYKKSDLKKALKTAQGEGNKGAVIAINKLIKKRGWDKKRPAPTFGKAA